MTARDILRIKGNWVISITPEASLHEAIGSLVEHSVGALLVVDQHRSIVGIITERDILREKASNLDKVDDAKVSDLMTSKVIIGLVDDSLEYIMKLMTEKRIRHLPILEDGRLAGILSIGDVVKARAQQAEVDIRYLTDYITGQYPV